MTEKAQELIDNLKGDISEIKKLNNGNRDKVVTLTFDNGDFAFTSQKECENHIKKIKEFDKQHNICKRAGNHKCNHWKKPTDKLGRLLTNTICRKEFQYFGYGRNIFHREAAEEIEYQLTKDLKSKLKWIWIILRG